MKTTLTLCVLAFVAMTSTARSQICPSNMATGSPPVPNVGASVPNTLAGISAPSASARAAAGATMTIPAYTNNYSGSYNMPFAPMGPAAQQTMQYIAAQRAAAVVRNQQMFVATQMSASRRNSITSSHAKRALAMADSAEYLGKYSTAARYYQRAAKAGATREAQAGLERIRRRRVSR